MGLQESACQPCSSGGEGSQVDREVHCSWPSDAEAENEAGDESGQEGDVWPGGGGEGKASQEGCQGLRGGSAEEEHLSRFFLRRSCVDSPHRAIATSLHEVK